MNFVLFKVTDCEEPTCLYEFDYYDSNLSILKYQSNKNKNMYPFFDTNLTLKLLDEKSIAKQKIKFASFLEL